MKSRAVVRGRARRRARYSRVRPNGVWSCAAPLTLACQLALAESAAPPLSAPVDAGTIEFDGFDVGVLSRRGIDASLASTLLQKPALEAGLHRLTLSVNGRDRGRATVRIDASGNPCFDQSLLDAAGIELPAGNDQPTARKDCQPFLEAYPETIVETDVAKLGLSLLVPTQALRDAVAEREFFSQGGAAGLFNYELSTFGAHSGRSSIRRTSLNSEIGFNAGSWIVRTRRVDSMGGSNATHSSIETFAQRSILSERAALQLGDLNIANPIVPTPRLLGAHFTSETALAVEEPPALIQGIAQTPSRVEVRQSGRVIYTTVVPAGPFSLKDVRPPNRQADIEVTVVESDGRQHGFVVPGLLLATTASPAGFSVGVGRARDAVTSVNQEVSEKSWVASLGWTGRMGRLLNGSVGAAASQDYRSAGAGLNLTLPRHGLSLQGQVVGSQATAQGRGGGHVQVAASQRIGEHWSVRAAISRQTRGYRTMLQSTQQDEVSAGSIARSQYSVGLGWGGSTIGSLSASYSRSTLFSGQRSNRWVASWGRSWRNASLNASVDWGDRDGKRDDRSAYISINVPLGSSRSARGYVRDRGKSTRYGIDFNDRPSETWSYRISAERDAEARSSTATVGASLLPRYTQLDLTASRDSGGSSSYTGLMRGGLVVHGRGVTPSPHRITDTFAIVSVGDSAGTKLSTPAGPIWTDASGRAIAAQLTPFGTSQVEVIGATLPRNADLASGLAKVKAARGAVDQLNFELRFVRRVLFTVRMPDGSFVPFGTAIADDSGQMIGLAMAEGRIFVNEYTPGMRLWASPAGEPRCELTFSLPNTTTEEDYYETVSAQCHQTP